MRALLERHVMGYLPSNLSTLDALGLDLLEVRRLDPCGGPASPA
jgi:hypothetical protein